jgi:signal transduction histidine kinase
VLLMALNDIRSCTHEEVPVRLKELGLLKSLEEMVQRFALAGGIKGSFSNAAPANNSESFDILRQLEIYRISSELIENIIKHASCSFLTINVSERDEALAINFLYDGHGINNEQAAELLHSAQGTGLRSCEARARLLNAEIDYMASPSLYSIELLVHYQWKNQLR